MLRTTPPTRVIPAATATATAATAGAGAATAAGATAAGGDPSLAAEARSIMLLSQAVGAYVKHELLRRSAEEAALELHGAVQRLAQGAPESLPEYFSQTGRLAAELAGTYPRD